jgi:hypothetical protein
MLTLDPNPTNDMTDNASPTLQLHLTDRLEPMDKKSATEAAPLARIVPKIDNALPNFTEQRVESVEPNCT